MPNVEVNTMTAERDTKDGPFCWQSKAALKLILESFGDAGNAACRPRSVYLALCEIASDEGAAQFVVTKGLLGYRAGLSTRTVQRVLPDLVRAGVLTISRNANGLKTASRYTLLSVSAPIGHGVSTSGHNVSTIGHGGGSSLADRYKEKKELKEPILAPVGAKVARSRNPVLDALVAIDGSDPAEVTGTAWSRAAKALAEIKEVCADVTPAEIARRAANYHTHFPDAAISTTALSKHWARCQHARATATTVRPEATVRRLILNAP